MYVDYAPYFKILNHITINETLYQLIAQNSKFDQAKSLCGMQKGSNGENGHLIEILNQQQQQVLLNLTSTINPWEDEYYWIGLKYNGSSYVWISGVVENYIENITILAAESYCVAVDREGNWLGLDCSDKYSYICQIRKLLITCKYIYTTYSAPLNRATSIPHHLDRLNGVIFSLFWGFVQIWRT